jgi:hypothetical protein
VLDEDEAEEDDDHDCDELLRPRGPRG